MSKRQFGLTVAAYLTGWVVAQSVFLRVWKYAMRDVYDEGYHDMARRMGKSLAEELEERSEELNRERSTYRQRIAHLEAQLAAERRVARKKESAERVDVGRAEQRDRHGADRIAELEAQLAAERRSVAVLKNELRQAAR